MQQCTGDTIELIWIALLYGYMLNGVKIASRYSDSAVGWAVKGLIPGSGNKFKCYGAVHKWRHAPSGEGISKWFCSQLARLLIFRVGNSAAVNEGAVGGLSPLLQVGLNCAQCFVLGSVLALNSGSSFVAVQAVHFIVAWEFITWWVHFGRGGSYFHDEMW
jgi:hypothetical protein